MATIGMKALTKEQMKWERVYDCHEPSIVFLRVFTMRDTLEEGRRKFHVDLDEPPTFVNLARCSRFTVDARTRAERENCKGIGYDESERIEFVRVSAVVPDDIYDIYEGFAVRQEVEDAAARCGMYCDASAPREGEER